MVVWTFGPNRGMIPQIRIPARRNYENTKKVHHNCERCALVLAFSLVTASAQEDVSQGVTEVTAAVSFESSFQVLNLSTIVDKAAGIDMYYYNQDGSLATMVAGKSNPVHDSVAYKQSNTYYPVDAAYGIQRFGGDRVRRASGRHLQPGRQHSGQGSWQLCRFLKMAPVASTSPWS